MGWISDPLGWVALVPVLLLALTVHEYGHALMASLCGDDTARLMGRVTLNPLAHLDPIGTIGLFFGPFGWGKPVPVNPRRLRHPRRDQMLVSLAGPLGNLIQLPLYALLGQLLFTSWFRPLFGETWFVFLLHVVSLGVILNMSLMLFNLLPIFPLDGSHILAYFLPDHWLDDWLEFQHRYGAFMLLGLIMISMQTGLLGTYITIVGRPLCRLLGVGWVMGG